MENSNPENKNLITSVEKWEESFHGNNNTGNLYEIETGKYILNNYSNILGVYNYTQKDNIGGTADIGILFKNNKLLQFSITKFYGKISKCIRNPSGVIYSLRKNQEMNIMNEESYILALNYRKTHKGITPNEKWKRCNKCPGSKNMCEYLAEISSKSWNECSREKKLENLIKLLDLNSKDLNSELKPNCDGIIYWDDAKKNIKVLKWSLKINLEDYLNTFHDGIYIYHGNPGDFILKTQTKYNNGIIEGMPSKLLISNWKPKKSENFLSSWNCVAPDLYKIFNIEELNLHE